MSSASSSTSSSSSSSSASASASASAPVADSDSLKVALSKLPAKWHPSLDASNPIPTLYWFPFSQPSRATAQLLAEGNIAHKKIEIDINSKMEQKDPLYMEFINPAGLVPALFKPAEGRWMAESNDIMKYLISIYPDRLSSFYPTQSDVSACEFIESQLKFISETVRPIATGLIRAIAGSKDKAEVLKKMEETPALVRQIEQHFQEAKQHFPALEASASASASSPAVTQSAPVVYFAGTDHPTIADLQLFHEIVATKDIGFFPWDAKTAPLLDRWYKTMANRPATKKTYAPIKNIAAILRVVLNVKRCFGGVTL